MGTSYRNRYPFAPKGTSQTQVGGGVSGEPVAAEEALHSGSVGAPADPDAPEPPPPNEPAPEPEAEGDEE